MLLTTWGAVGEDAVKQSFARCILDIPSDKQLGYTEWIQFEEAIQQLFSTVGCSTFTIEACEQYLKEFEVTYKDEVYTVDSLFKLNTVVQQDNPDLIIQGGYYGEMIEFILGSGQTFKQGDVTVFVFEREVWRSPTTIMAMAAMIGNKQIFVRREALKTIMYYKWKTFVQYPAFGYTDAEQQSIGFKKEVLNAYGINTLADFEAVEEAFISDLQHNVLTHEYGHAVIQHQLLSLKVATMGEGIKNLGPQVMTDLLEVLADIAPENAGLRGPLWSMMDKKASNPVDFYRRFWMYRSDTWFFDTQDEYMYRYSRWLDSIMKTCYETPSLDYLGTLCHFVIAITEALGKAINALLEKTGILTGSFEDYVKNQRKQAPNDVLGDEYMLYSWCWGKVFNAVKEDADVLREIEALFLKAEQDMDRLCGVVTTS